MILSIQVQAELLPTEPHIPALLRAPRRRERVQGQQRVLARARVLPLGRGEGRGQRGRTEEAHQVLHHGAYGKHRGRVFRLFKLPFTCIHGTLDINSRQNRPFLLCFTIPIPLQRDCLTLEDIESSYNRNYFFTMFREMYSRERTGESVERRPETLVRYRF